MNKLTKEDVEDIIVNVCIVVVVFLTMYFVCGLK
jgi:hypothetical protein